VDSIIIDLNYIVCENVGRIHLAWSKERLLALVNTVISLRIP